MRVVIGLAALGMLLPALAADGASVIDVPCQKNVGNGKFIIDADVLPANAEYVVERFVAERPDAVWTDGRCKIRLKPPHLPYQHSP